MFQILGLQDVRKVIKDVPLHVFFWGGCCGSGQDVQNFITFSDGIFPYVLEMSCFKFQVSRMSGRSSMTPLSTMSRVGSLEDWWSLTNFLDVRLCPRDVMFQISGLQDIRKAINDTPIHHLQVWFLGGQVVPDTLFGCMISLQMPSFKFQLSRMSERSSSIF